MLRASKAAFKEFVRSTVWADLKDILNERIAINQEELDAENLNEDVWIDIRRVASLRAKLGELRYLASLPKFLLDQHEELAKIEEGEKDDGTE